MQVVVCTDKNFNAWEGFDLFPRDQNAKPEAAPKVHRLLRATTPTDFKQLVADDLGLEADLIRPWSVVARQNATIRPDTPLDANSPTIEDALVKVQNKPPFRVWIETVKRKADGTPAWSDNLINTGIGAPARPILLFLKHFDTEQQSLTGIGHVYANRQGKISDIVPEVLELMNWPAGTELRMWEVSHDLLFPGSSTLTVFSGDQVHYD